MQKRFDLFKKVLDTFHEAGILNEMILVGSWCMHFYENYFPAGVFHPTIRTRDIDFLVPIPIRSGSKVDIAELLRDDGFIVTFNRQGYMRLEHPDLIIEFLVPEKGKGTDKPYPLPHLGVNAQALRFLDFLTQHSILIQSEGFRIRVPHPAAFGLHKLIISQRRKSEEKSLKEIGEAINVLNTLAEIDRDGEIQKVFHEMPSNWRKKIIGVLEEVEDEHLQNILK